MMLAVPKFLATESAAIEIAGGTDENGALKIVSTFDVKCRHQQSNSVVYTKEGTKVTLKGKAFIFEQFELFPDNDASGFCTIGGIKYDMVHSSKKRNPDGSVNHIVLELI